ncbi:hypothetical protein A4H97_18805 [Niastella yeongjuensis]|uniref:DUF5977 domain-containing protein n=1 Tax=Niastella yeongjuensis TaxID=354355 RepID=A0A1V9DY89_9BACT|nr:hypothetical protein [Niastella yeongjuensis]OQP38769.1 hypothetical protein A4H97_18805 [Niastella yeongjuensis]SEO33305.1 hypothetical protein SAMN05660816_02642 [Niastella yeongjuensis]
MKKIYLFRVLIFLLSITNRLFAQDLPKIIPPDPIAMQYQKYGDYPVSNFTGVPDIIIPLYSIKEGDLEVPISLSYHASGIKPTDPNGMVGAGWVLNTGGIITRTQLKSSDESALWPDYYGWPTEEHVNHILTFDRNNSDSLMYLSWAAQGNTMPDIFSYNFLGNTGKFIFRNFHPINYNEECLLFDYKPLSIKGERTDGHLAGFDVIDEKGLKYAFNYPGSGGVGSGSTAWLLNTLTSATDPANVIAYTYRPGYSETVRRWADTYTRDDNASTLTVTRGNCGGSWPIASFANYYEDPDVFESYPLETATMDAPAVISFRSGEVRFSYDGTTKRLSRMEVYDKSNNLIKRIDFTINQTSWTTRAFLKEIKFYDATGAYLNKYAFNYNSESSQQFATNKVGVDFWGYYNGNNSMPLIPTFKFEFYGYAGSFMSVVGTNDRQTSEELMKIYTLEEIIYPTGGKTDFEFEANKIDRVGIIPNYYTLDVGGLRIKRKLNYTADGKLAEVKEYEYSGAQMDVLPTKEYFSSSQYGGVVAFHGFEMFRRVYVTSDPTVDIAPHGSPVVYTTVKEHTMGADYKTGVPYATTEYGYDYKPYTYAFSTTNGPTNDGNYPIYRAYQNVYEAHNDGKLTYISKYGPNNKVTSTYYEYEEIPGESVRGFYGEDFAFWIPDPCPCDEYGACSGNPDDTWPRSSGVWSAWNFGDVVFNSSRKRLISETTVDNVQIQTDYVYDNPIHEQPTKKIVQNSKSETITTTYTYPHDYPSQEPYASMISRHIWSPVIEEKTTKAGIFDPLQIVKTNFASWNGMILPQSVETKVQKNAQEERTRFDSYDDRGNVTTVSKTNDVKMSYVWGYNKTMPIAEVTNASADQIAYTSFEDLEYGGWSLKPGSYCPWYNDVTGRRICVGGVTKTVPAGSYVVTLWANGNCTVNGLAGTQLAVSKRIGSWRLLEWKLDNVSAVDINGDYIDEVRLYPADAQMVTYTYDPLIGMTAKTDVNNRISYFEYDAAGRLLHIKDDAYNILKKYQYAYQDNSENADQSRVPQWQYTGGFKYTYCQQNPLFITDKLLEEVDANPNSTTYGTNRYIINTGNIPDQSALEWQYTDNYMCEEVDGQKTGRQFREQKNVNPCSLKYNNTRWAVFSTNSPDCKKPAIYTNTVDLSEYYYSSLCADGYAPLPVYVSMPPGKFTSTISYDDVLVQASNYAHSIADQTGQCELQPIQVSFANNSSEQGEKFEIIMRQVNNTDINYDFKDVDYYQNLEILPGTYEMWIYPKSWSIFFPVSYVYYLGCNDELVGGEVYINRVTFSTDCNTITIL